MVNYLKAILIILLNELKCLRPYLYLIKSVLRHYLSQGDAFYHIPLEMPLKQKVDTSITKYLPLFVLI